MFVRMLKLPDAVRLKYDVSSMKSAIHAAAPCPIEVKAKMIEWWGPIVCEYYAGTEGNGFSICNAQTGWPIRARSAAPSSARSASATRTATSCRSARKARSISPTAAKFEYHNDPKKTAELRHAKDWSTLGDVGKLDADGYLYLTDRKAFMIISGGVNIYPQEAENLLIAHPKVADFAVIGVPNEDFGEEVKAVVQPRDGQMPDRRWRRSSSPIAANISRRSNARAPSISNANCRAIRPASSTSA